MDATTPASLPSIFALNFRTLNFSALKPSDLTCCFFFAIATSTSFRLLNFNLAENSRQPQPEKHGDSPLPLSTRRCSSNRTASRLHSRRLVPHGLGVWSGLRTPHPSHLGRRFSLSRDSSHELGV